MIDGLLDRLRRGDRAALARLLTLAARGEAIDALAHGLDAHPTSARVVAVTGAGGVGKSTLVGKLLPVVRRHGRTVAVLACDPQSPLTGGALLGDRFRMGSPTDDGVFVRSVAAAGGRGAVAEHVDLMVRLCEAYGFAVVVLETVGAGQGDVAVAGLADAVVLLVQPEAGDDVQWEKAGILEFADVVAVHKADLPAADRTAAQVTAALALAPQPPPIVRVSSHTGQGIDELWQAIAGLPLRRGRRTDPDELLRLAQAALARRWSQARRAADAELAALVGRWQRGDGSAAQAVQELLHWLAARENS